MSGERPPWCLRKAATTDIYPFAHLHNEILEFQHFIQPINDEYKTRRLVIDEVSLLVHSLWDRATIHVMGSGLTGIITPYSDIDLTILNVPITTSIPDALHALAGVIRKENIANYIEVISSAKVPIVKLDHFKSGLSIDLQINNTTGLSTGIIVHKYVEVFPPLAPLMLVLKTFLSQRKLNDTYTGGIGSFVLCMMIVNFLQMRQQELTLTSNTNSPHAWNLGVLLVDFFDLYGGSFNLIHTGISTTGNGSYFNKQNRGSTDWFNTARPTLLAIENPDLNDVNMGNNSFMITKIRKCFEHMRLVCGNIMKGNSKSYLAHIIRPDDPVLVARAKKLFSLTSDSSTHAIVPHTPPVVYSSQPARSSSSHSSGTKNTMPNQDHKMREKEAIVTHKHAHNTSTRTVLIETTNDAQTTKKEKKNKKRKRARRETNKQE